MNRNGSIGVIDSGVGGLTVAKEIMRQLPNESIIYLGDNARCPYGSRPLQEIQQFTWEMVNFLLEKNIKMLIIACNTAASVTLEEICERVTIPVLGVIHPGAHAAIDKTRNLHIGVIGTAATITSKAYEIALTDTHPGVKVTSLACPRFVPVVESGEWASTLAQKIVQETLQPFQNTGIDTMVLGCTHYPLLQQPIAEVLGSEIAIISSGDETARETNAILQQSHLRRQSSEPPVHQFYTTGSKQMFNRIAVELFGKEVEQIEKVEIAG